MTCSTSAADTSSNACFRKIGQLFASSVHRKLCDEFCNLFTVPMMVNATFLKVQLHIFHESASSAA